MIGNDHADHFAGRGVDVALSLAPNDSMREAYRNAKSWYRWLAVLAANWPSDVQVRTAAVPREPRRRPAPAVEAPYVLHEVSPHQLIEDGNRLYCSRCPRYLSRKTTPGLRRVFAAGACQGHMAEVVTRASAARGQVNAEGVARRAGHTLMVTGRITWCSRCGCYAESLARGLRRECRPDRCRTAQLRRLREGRHPASNVRLTGPTRHSNDALHGDAG